MKKNIYLLIAGLLFYCSTAIGQITGGGAGNNESRQTTNNEPGNSRTLVGLTLLPIIDLEEVFDPDELSDIFVTTGVGVRIAKEQLSGKEHGIVDGAGLCINSAFGLAGNASSTDFNVNKYFMSFYGFKEFGSTKPFGILAGLGANYTTASIPDTDISTGYFTVGLHTGLYLQSDPSKKVFIRVGFDQYVMVRGAFINSIGISLGFN